MGGADVFRALPAPFSFQTTISLEADFNEGLEKRLPINLAGAYNDLVTPIARD